MASPAIRPPTTIAVVAPATIRPPITTPTPTAAIKTSAEHIASAIAAAIIMCTDCTLAHVIDKRTADSRSAIMDSIMAE